MLPGKIGESNLNDISKNSPINEIEKKKELRI
jgi:hypothetical protein